MTTHFHLVRKLIMSGTLPLLLMYIFIACARSTVPLRNHLWRRLTLGVEHTQTSNFVASLDCLITRHEICHVRPVLVARSVCAAGSTAIFR